LGSYSNHNVTIRTHNNAVMTLTASGNVGIGTTSPGSLLSLYQTSSNPVLALFQNGSTTNFKDSILMGGTESNGWSTPNGAGIDLSVNYAVDANARLNFWSYPQTSAAPSMTVMNGNVGIGTTSPSYTLDVSGTGHFTGNAYIAGGAGTATANLTITGSDGNYLLDLEDPSNRSWYLKPSGQDLIWTTNDVTNILTLVGNTGYIGIGTAAPAALLQVHNTADNGDGLIVAPDRDGDNTISIQSYIDSAAAGGLAGGAGYAGGCCDDLALNPDWGQVSVGGVGSYTNKFNVIGNSYFSGNVGIGTTSPAGMLDVEGGSVAIGTTSVHGTNFFVRTNGTNEDFSIHGPSTLTNGVAIEVANDAWNADTPLEIRASPTIFTTGSVGIGTSTPATRLDVGGGAISGVSNISGASNSSAYTIWGGGPAGLNGGYVQLWGSTSGNPNLLTFGNSSGEMMRITSGGFVGIGTTSPIDMLQVAGGIRSTGSANNYGSGNQLTMDYNGGTSRINTTNPGVNTATLSLMTNSATALFINASGNVGIGTTVPNNKFDILAVNTAGAGNLQANAGLRIDESTSSVALLEGVDSTNTASYIQSMQPNVSWTNRPLVLNPNGGAVEMGQGSYIYPGCDGNSCPANPQASYYIATDGSYGLITNTGWNATNYYIAGVGWIWGTFLNQGVMTTSSPTFASVNISSGTNELIYDAGSGTLNFRAGTGGTNAYFSMYGNGNFTAQGSLTTGGDITANGAGIALYAPNGDVYSAGNVIGNGCLAVGVGYSCAGAGGGSGFFAGNIYCGACGNWLTALLSDARLKKDVEEVSGLDTIMKLRPVSFYWKKDSKNRELVTDKNKKARSFGFIAQEVEKVLPDVVEHTPPMPVIPGEAKDPNEPKDGYLGMNYTSLISPIVKAVQELYGKWSADHDILVKMEADNDNSRALEEKQLAVLKADSDKQLATLRADNDNLRRELEGLKARLVAGHGSHP